MSATPPPLPQADNKKQFTVTFDPGRVALIGGAAMLCVGLVFFFLRPLPGVVETANEKVFVLDMPSAPWAVLISIMIISLAVSAFALFTVTGLNERLVEQDKTLESIIVRVDMLHAEIASTAFRAAPVCPSQPAPPRYEEEAEERGDEGEDDSIRGPDEQAELEKVQTALTPEAQASEFLSKLGRRTLGPA